MKAITKDGTSYEMKFTNTLTLMELYFSECDERRFDWYNFGALIKISDKWYHCQPKIMYLDDKMTPYVCLGSSAKDALGINTQKNVSIFLDSIPKEEFDEFYNDLIQSVKEKANALNFTYIEFTHDYICNSDCEEDYRYLYFNEKALSILNAFNALEKFEDRLKFTSFFERLDTIYRVDATNEKSLFALAAPKIKEIEVRKEKNEKIRRVKEAIENGAVSFRCESAPHEEDLSEVILTRPCPNAGLFVLTHRVSSEVFFKIKKFGVYYDRDFLEECDMFCSVPGWRFGKEAIETLLDDNVKVFVDYEEVVRS